MNLLTSGGLGGIETLCRELAKNTTYDDIYVFVFGGGVVYDQMRENGNAVYCLDDSKKITVSKYRKLVELAKDVDIIVVHHGDVFLHTYFLLLKKKYPKKKYVYTAHSCFSNIINNKKPKYKLLIMKYVMGKAISKSDKFISVSKAGLESYKCVFTIPSPKAEIVYNGIGRAFFESPVEKKRAEVIRILYVGRLVSIKGIHLLIESLVNLTKKHNVFLKIVGDGSQLNELKELVNKKNISSYVAFEGAKDNVIPYLKEADIFVYPSTCQEILGISIIEAMSMGNICVANRVGGIPEIISDGVNGFLTEEISSSGVEKAIERAINALSESPEMIDRAIETAQKFSIVNTASELQKIYSRLICDDSMRNI